MNEQVADISCGRKTVNSLKITNLKLLLDTLTQRLSDRTSVSFFIDDELKGIYFQDDFMKIYYRNFPEHLSLHLAAKVIELEMILYVLIAEDSNGHCEVIGAFFLFNDDEDSIRWLLKSLKTHYLLQTKILLLDYHIDRKLLDSDFSSCQVLQSRFHSTQCLKEHLLERHISSRNLSTSVRLLENALSVTHDDVLNEVCNKFQELSIELGQYFQEQWQNNRETWELSLKFKSKVFLRPLDKFLQRISKKFKVIYASTSLEKTMNVFYEVVLDLRKDHFLRVSSVVQSIGFNSLTLEQRMYVKTLSNYASKLVLQQMLMTSNVGGFELITKGKYKVLGGRNEITTVHCCTCDFKQYASLPCCHILGLRSALSVTLFDETLCSPRWFRQSYREFFVSLHSPYLRQYDPSYDFPDASLNFEKSVEVLSHLSPFLWDTSHPHHDDRLEVLKLLHESWSVGFNVDLDVVEHQIHESAQPWTMNWSSAGEASQLEFMDCSPSLDQSPTSFF